jgi:hypothetical protein
MTRSLRPQVALPCTILLVTATVACAACITPKQIIDAADKTAAAKKSDGTTLYPSDPASPSNFAKDLVTAVWPKAAEQLAKTTIVDQIGNLKDDTWEKKPFDMGHDTDKQVALRKYVTLIQSWANFGEIVVAVNTDNSKIGIVVPADAVPGANDAGKWKDLPIPHVAFAGNSIGTTTAWTVIKDTPINLSISDDPEKIVVYRYKL